MKVLVQCAAIGGAGAAGALLRFVVAVVCGRLFRTSFPVGTLVINLSGSLFLGWFIAVTRGRIMAGDTLYLAIAVGFVGAYTTFSTFMYESDKLLQDGAALKATLNLGGSLILGLLAVRCGLWLGGR
jgi:CrcB protein